MKHSLLTIIITLILSACQQKTDYDVIIIGGGLAGLSAAKELNKKNVLIIEKDSLLGGRVRTANYNNTYFYDLGAVFALDTNYRDIMPIEDHEYIEDAPIGFWFKDKLYTGKDVYECLKQMEDIDSNYIRSLYKSKTLDGTKLDKPLYDILNTNMKAVFPGAMNQYNTDIQPFAWIRYNSSHFKHGNQEVTRFILKDARFQYQLNTMATKVSDKSKYVEVIISKNGYLDTLTARKVIVATPATVAKKIIEQQHESSASFLNGIRYAGYYSIAIGVKAEDINPKVSYLMPVNTGFASILQQKTSDADFTIFQLYIAEEDMTKFPNDSTIKSKSIQTLKDIWHIQDKDVVFYEQFYWKNAGVLVNEHYKKKWAPDAFRPSNNVYLAGDYCQMDYNMPYGMIPAINSGKTAAQKIKKDK